MQTPLRQIAENAGEDGAVIAGKVLDKDEYNWGFDAQTGEFKDLVKAGIIDPTKVVRTALQDAASVAGLLVTTEAMVAEKPEKKAPADARRAAAAWATWTSESEVLRGGWRGGPQGPPLSFGAVTHAASVVLQVARPLRGSLTPPTAAAPPGSAGRASTNTVFTAIRLRRAIPSGSPVFGIHVELREIARRNVQPDAVARQEQVGGGEQRDADAHHLAGRAQPRMRGVLGIAQPHDAVGQDHRVAARDSRPRADARRSAWR